MRRTPPPALPPLLVVLLLACACSRKEASAAADRDGPPVTVVDAAGVERVLPGPAHRIVSLVPSATLTLDSLGARDALVARTDFDTASWAAALPSVGGGLNPSIEALVAVRPDLVIVFAGSQDPRTPARLEELGIPHVAVRPDRIADVKSTIELLGRATGHEERADSLVARIDRSLREVRGSVAGLPRVRVAYVLGGSPPWVAGPGTYIDELITVAGGDNAFDDLGSLYAAVSPEELISRRIDVVLLAATTAFDHDLVPGARVVRVSGDVERPGPDVAAAARALARALHGDSVR